MVTKGAPTALSLREFPDELPCYLHASEATPGASTMALAERMEQYRSGYDPPPKINTIFLIKSWLQWYKLYLPECFIEINVRAESNASASGWMKDG